MSDERLRILEAQVNDLRVANASLSVSVEHPGCRSEHHRGY